MASRKISFLVVIWPSPSGRGLGEGLGRTKSAEKIVNSLSHWERVGVRGQARQLGFFSLSPHPQPFSQREKGERQTWCLLQPKALFPDPSPKGRRE